MAIDLPWLEKAADVVDGEGPFRHFLPAQISALGVGIEDVAMKKSDPLYVDKVKFFCGQIKVPQPLLKHQLCEQIRGQRSAVWKPVEVIQHFLRKPVSRRKPEDGGAERIFSDPILNALKPQKTPTGQDRIQGLQDLHITIKVNTPHLIDPLPAEIIRGETEILLFHLSGDEPVFQREVVPGPLVRGVIGKVLFPCLPVASQSVR